MKIFFGLLFLMATVLAESKAPSIELRDQFDAPQKLSFPASQITILTIADRKGSDQVDGWIAALKPRYAGRLEFRGIAQVSAVPGFLQSHVRKKFQETRKYPVMMDWTGEACKQLGAAAGVANLLVIDRTGQILGRYQGKAGSNLVAEASLVIDKALSVARE